MIDKLNGSSIKRIHSNSFALLFLMYLLCFDYEFYYFGGGDFKWQQYKAIVNSDFF